MDQYNSVNSAKVPGLKRLFTITLIGLYLFNLSGYFLFYKYFIHQSDQKIISRLDADQYNDSELMEVKIPLHLPYVTSQNHYERVNGELQYKGVYYNYVKRKVSNDTLYLLCISNVQKTNLHQELTEYAKKVNDIPANDKNGNSVKKPVLASEYVQHLPVYEISSAVFSSKDYQTGINMRLPDSFIPDYFKPPRIRC